MYRVIVSGCNGKMGRAVVAQAASRGDCEVVAGFDVNTARTGDFPVFANPENCQLEADAIIDFSHPDGLRGVLTFARERRIPAVIATTGLDEARTALVREAAAEIPVFFSGNMSLGVSLLQELVKKAAAVLGGSFDIEIVEKHHNQKVDAPSGTALMLADAAKQGLAYEPRYVMERHSVRERRGTRDIGFASVRGGTIVGEHEVIFAGHDEVLTLSHSALSKEIFANGAIAAALFLRERAPGLYNMADIVRV